MDTTKAITHISLCSGYEGIGLGLRRVLPNLREIAFVEREGFPVANLVAKMEAGELDSAPVFTDVKQFPYGKFRGQVDILSGGFPCQPFSCAGQRKATDDPRHLFPYIRDGIRDCKPRIVFLENVGGIISAKTADGESVLKYVLRELEGLGYRATAGIFSAEEVGAPHQRKRVFILGVGEELGNAKHDGLYGTTESRGTTETVQHNPQGKDSTCQSQRTDSPPELANSIGSGLEGHGGDEHREGRQSTGQSRPVTTSSFLSRWPSRPGEPQYEWEEPRVTAVADPKSQQGSSPDNGGEPRASSQSEEVQLGGGHSGSLRESNGQAESELGRAPDGTTCGVDATTNRVDRLRLLGNGVVNQTAAKAFVTLIQRVTNK